MTIEEILACPSCRNSLCKENGYFKCVECSCHYPILEGDIIDFISDNTKEGIHWDKEAQADHIHAAVSVPKEDISNIFVKLPPMLQTSKFEGNIHVDLGCGYGRTLIYAIMTAHPLISIGVDISLTMLKKTREYASQYNVHPMLIRGNIGTLPLQSAMIDSIYSSAVLFHIQKNSVYEIIREVARVLKKEGMVVFERSFPGWLNPDGFQTKIITSLFSSLLSPAWVRTYSYREVCSILTSGKHFSSLHIQPENYKILPKAFFKYALPICARETINSMNESVSRILHFKNLFVSGWSVAGTK
jgi:ubiquinone/menaquinone biosynthesis C-methylase UbiE